MSEEAVDHFVYVYRDAQGNPVYFGQGKRITRPASHQRGTHNTAFEAWIEEQAGRYKIEVIGPLGSKEMADALETALVSACLPAKALQPAFFNVHRGNSQFRFRPFGVPDKFAERTLDPIGPAELRTLCRRIGSVMFVRINQKNFESDGRRGYDLVTPPSDNEILDRVDKWWQVANRVDEWADSPESSPAMLVGVTGLPGAQSIIASVQVDRDNWTNAVRESHGLLQIPVHPDDLDVQGLRGRPLNADVGLSFNSFRNAQFRIFTSKGFEVRPGRNRTVRE